VSVLRTDETSRSSRRHWPQVLRRYRPQNGNRGASRYFDNSCLIVMAAARSAIFLDRALSGMIRKLPATRVLTVAGTEKYCFCQASLMAGTSAIASGQRVHRPSKCLKAIPIASTIDPIASTGAAEACHW
jgi:hypothetical protein